MQNENEQSLTEREKELEEREKALEEREKALENKPFSRAVQNKKEGLYDQLNVTKHTMDVIVGVTAALLGIVVVLIILEAAGIFKIG